MAQDSEIAEGGRKVVVAGGAEIGLFRHGGTLYAWRNECPHQGGPVCQGPLFRRTEERLDDERRSLGVYFTEGKLNIVCPWHGYEFDVTSGRHAGAGTMRLAPYPIHVREGDIYVVVGS